MPMSEETLTMLTLLTAATRRPAATTGTAGGRATEQERQSRQPRVLAGAVEDVAEVVQRPGHRADALSSAAALRSWSAPALRSRRASMAGTTSAAVIVPTSRPSSSTTTPRPLGEE